MKRNGKVILTLSLMLSLAACGSGQNDAKPVNNDNTTKESANTAKDKSVTIKYSFWGDTATKDLHMKVIEEFMKKHPNITVEPVYIAADYLTKIQTTFAGGTQPDLINFTTSDLTSFAAAGVLEPITQWVKRDWDKDNLGDNFERMMKALQYNGEQYALPRNASGRTIFYNKKLFDEAGVKYPDSSWTWDTLIQEGKKLTNNDSDPNKRTYAFGFLPEDSTFHANFVWQAGGDYFSADGKKFILGSNEGNQGFQFIHDLIYKYKISPEPSTYTSAKPADMFINGKLAMHIDAGSFIVNMQKAKFEWDVALLPQGPKNRDSAISPTGLAIPKNSKNKEAAWELEKFINGPVGQEILISTGFSAPVRQSILNDEKKYLPPDQFKVNRKIALEAYSSHGRVKPNHPLWTQSDTIMAKYLKLYFLDKNGDISSVMKQIEGEINPILAKQK